MNYLHFSSSFSLMLGPYLWAFWKKEYLLTSGVHLIDTKVDWSEIQSNVWTGLQNIFKDIIVSGWWVYDFHLIQRQNINNVL